MNSLGSLNGFVSGMLVMGCLVAGLFFLRYWKQTRDRLFLFFALAFWVYAGQRIAVASSRVAAEDQIVQYVIRLVAFLLILIAIIDKNRPRR
jgi:Fe2+ transport system protein B